MGFSGSFVLLADVHVCVVVSRLHPFDVAELHCIDGLSSMQVLVDDQLVSLDNFVVCFANECCLNIVADVVVQDFGIHLLRS